LAGFQVTLIGRFWVIPEAFIYRGRFEFITAIWVRKGVSYR